MIRVTCCGKGYAYRDAYTFLNINAHSLGMG